jgi:hypothetical protein
MADVDLTSMNLELLPRIAYASAEDVLPPHPDKFEAVENNLEGPIRPKRGLWCSPITAYSVEGATTATAWTEFLATPDETGLPSAYDGRYTKFTEVKPLLQAQIYRIDTADDLNRLEKEFRLPPEHPMHRIAPNWEAMAESGWDAVYVSEAGITANAQRLPIGGPSLAQWDCSSVLWLHPTYWLATS